MVTHDPVAAALRAATDIEGWPPLLGAFDAALAARSSSAVLFDCGRGAISYAATGCSAEAVVDLVESGIWTGSDVVRAPHPSVPMVVDLPDPRHFRFDPVAARTIRAGQRHHIAVLFRLPDSRNMRIAFERGDGARPFGPGERRRLERLRAPLFHAVCSSVAAAERAGRAAFVALERAEVPAALLNIDGCVVAATSAAALDRPPFRKRHDGKLTLRDPAEQAQFQAALRRAVSGGTPSPLRLGGRLAMAAEVHLAPAAGGAGTGPGAAECAVLMLLRARPGSGHPLAALSPAERALAELVAQGAPLAEAAARRGITPKTARTYLERSYAKTGVTSRAALVALVIGAGEA